MSRLKRFKVPKVSTVIGDGTQITGDVEFAAGLHLDGSIKGKVNGTADSGATLTVGGKGQVEGDVRVENLILNGVIKGDVFASGRVELAAAARVTGTVHYKLLEMAMGAEVNGKLVHSDETEPRRLEFDGETPADGGESPPA